MDLEFLRYQCLCSNENVVRPVRYICTKLGTCGQDRLMNSEAELRFRFPQKPGALEISAWSYWFMRFAEVSRVQRLFAKHIHHYRHSVSNWIFAIVVSIAQALGGVMSSGFDILIRNFHQHVYGIIHGRSMLCRSFRKARI